MRAGLTSLAIWTLPVPETKTSVSRVMATSTRPADFNISRSRKATARLMSFSLTPALTAPASLPPCPGSIRTMGLGTVRSGTSGAEGKPGGDGAGPCIGADVRRYTDSARTTARHTNRSLRRRFFISEPKQGPLPGPCFGHLLFSLLGRQTLVCGVAPLSVCFGLPEELFGYFRELFQKS